MLGNLHQHVEGRLELLTKERMHLTFGKKPRRMGEVNRVNEAEHTISKTLRGCNGI